MSESGLRGLKDLRDDVVRGSVLRVDEESWESKNLVNPDSDRGGCLNQD